MIRNIKIPVLFVSLLFAAGGCLKEDNSDCPRGLYIRFVPENPKHDLSELIRELDLYFYDEAGDLAVQLSFDKGELQREGGAVITSRIPPGKYTVVSLINDVDENYHTVNKQRLESLQTYLKNEISRDRLVDFFSGLMEITVTRGGSPQEVIMDVFKHNNNIRLDIVLDGFEMPQGLTIYSFIEGNNGEYNYLDGTCPGDSYRKYLPYLISDNRDGVWSSSEFTVMRLWRDSDLILHLQEVNQNQEVTASLEINIADELAKVKNDKGEFLYDTDAKLSFHDEFEIVITLQPDLKVIKLTINDWYVIGGGVDV